jgi:hypothetical protein
MITQITIYNVQTNPFITTSVYTTPRLYRQILWYQLIPDCNLWSFG